MAAAPSAGPTGNGVNNHHVSPNAATSSPSTSSSAAAVTAQGMNTPEVVAYSTIVLTYVMPHVVTDLQSQGVTTAQDLDQSLRKAEAEIPGIAYQIIADILHNQSPDTNVLEQLLRLTSRSGHGPDPYLTSLGSPYADIERHACEVKRILSSLPELVKDRSRFLTNIKEIAVNLKSYLTALIHIIRDFDSRFPNDSNSRRKLQYRKPEFSRTSRYFSDKLKDYFHDNSNAQVMYPSALVLIANNYLFSQQLKDILVQHNITPPA